MKWFLMLAVGITMGLGIAGCGGGDDGNVNPLIGTWRLESFNNLTIPANVSEVMIFRNNGTVESSRTVDGEIDITSLKLATWSESNGVITMTTDTETTTVPYSISGNTLTLLDPKGTMILKRQ